ncbi:MAG: polysaccharide deacetylase family protein [Flavitalea sp.]
MLNFRNTNILFVLLLVGLITWDINHGVGWYFYLLLFVVYSLVLFWGSAKVTSNFYIKVLNSAADRLPGGVNTEKQIAISFDDGPSGKFTPGILDVLNAQQVPTVFFCIGKNIAGNEVLLKRIVDEGHIIGNHSYSHHFWFDMYSSGKMTEDLATMNVETLRVTGLKPALFRPPYGVTNPNLAKAIRSGGFTPVGWNIRSMDTVVKEPEKLLADMLAAVKPGAIVLFHDTCEATFLMLPAFIDKVKNMGYEFVRPDKMLNVSPYA